MNEVITKNKIIELPCFVGDIVYKIDFPTQVTRIGVDRPRIIEMTVIKVEYSAAETASGVFERMRIDVKYMTEFGYEKFDWAMWNDGFFYVTRAEAEKKLNSLN